MLVVEYSSVTQGYERDGLDNLLTRSAQLIKNLEPLTNSVSLVVTKVPSFKMRGRKYIDVYDADIKSATAKYIDAHRTLLQQKLSEETKDKSIIERKIQIIDALLYDDAVDFPKISLFWRPNDVGSFDTIDKMIDGRQLIRNSILTQISYAPIYVTDFGYPLSVQAQMFIHDAINHIVDEIYEELARFCDKIQRIGDFSQKVTWMQSRQDFMIAFDSPDPLQTLITQFEYIISTQNISALNDETVHALKTNHDQMIRLNSLISNESIFTDDNYSSTRIQNMIVLFMELARAVEREILTEMDLVKERIAKSIVDFDIEMHDLLDNILSIKFYNWHWKLQILTNLRDNIKVSNESSFMKLKDLSNKLHMHWDAAAIENDDNYMKMLSSGLDSDTVRPTVEWNTPLKSMDLIESEYEWTSFLMQTYSFLSRYDVQRDVTAYSVANLSHWGHLNMPQGLIIDENNFDEFTRLIKTNAEVTQTPQRIFELHGLVDRMLNSPISTECDDSGKMIIKANFFKSSDIRDLSCPKGVQLIEIYIVDTFYVDANVTLNVNSTGIDPIELHILAHTWNILQPTVFNLNGTDGEQLLPPATNGTAGKRGNPGSDAGHFYGFAYTVVNGGLLEIHQTGGRGGKGQDGTGHPDVRVSFNRQNDTHTFTVFKPIQNRDYLIQLLKKESHVDNITLIGSDMDDISVYLVYANLETHTNFSLHANECCGNTGRGGPGKTIIHLLLFCFITFFPLFSSLKRKSSFFLIVHSFELFLHLFSLFFFFVPLFLFLFFTILYFIFTIRNK